MFQSERFLGRLSKLRKEHRDEPHDEQVALVRPAFIGVLPALPGSMADEVFDLFAERIIERSGSAGVFFDDARYLADVADLFAEQYDEQNDPLDRSDWAVIGDIVNDYALDLDMGWVTYVMKLVVDHGGIGSQRSDD
ncbi:MAG: hypothetical protein EA382_15160 [Spirochaetaceae bacterium]|nr:MAG: hypothetical protein EA382_15160 [Spirochaetaceae bacterium]